MPTVERTVRAAARAKSSQNKARNAGVEAKRSEAILNSRAVGMKVDRIAAAQKLSVYVVRQSLEMARLVGDPRALTDRQAAAKVKAIAAEAERVENAEAPLPDVFGQVVQTLAHFVEVEAPKEVRSRPEPSAIDMRLLPTFAYVSRLRDMAKRYQVVAPNVGAGFEHLADLYEHHDRQYPTHDIPSDYVTQEMTDRRFPRHAPIASMMSPTALCSEA